MTETQKSDLVAKILSHLSKIAVAAAMLFLAILALPRAEAGGGGFAGATEMTQYANNVELAYQTVEQSMQTVQDELRNVQLVEQTYYQKLQQLQESIGQYTAPFQKAYDTYKTVVETKQKLVSFAADLSSLDTALEDRMRQMSASALDMNSFLEREKRLIQGGDARARAQMKSNIETLEKTQSSLQAYQASAERMAKTVGTHGATQVLGAQLAMLGGDLNKLIAITAQSNTGRAAEAQERAAQEDLKLKAYEAFMSEVAAERKARRAALGMKDE